MPALSYPNAPFVPFTKILSSAVNGNFAAITTLLNTTKLDTLNVQLNGLAWNRLTLVTSVQVAVTDTLGQLTTSQALPMINGGLGFSFAPTTLVARQVIQVNAAGTALTVGVVPVAGPSLMYLWNHFL